MILGALLAAGTGSRFEGENKLLADLDGRPVVAHAARSLTASSLDASVAVVGHDRAAVERALPDEIAVVANPDYERGQSASVRRAVAAARERDAETGDGDAAAGDRDAETDDRDAGTRERDAETGDRDVEAVLFALGDMPCVAVETVDAVLRAYRESGDTGIVAPRYEGRRGNPVLFGARYFDALADVTGDRGGRDLVESEPVAWVDVPDPGVHRDVDTERDLRALQGESDPERE